MATENCTFLTNENCTHSGGGPQRVSQASPNRSDGASGVGQRERSDRSPAPEAVLLASRLSCSRTA